MKFFRTLPRFVATLLLILPVLAWANPIPVSDFYKRPPMTGFQLSPNGKYLAAVVPIGQRRNVAVIDLETRKAWPVTSITKQDIGGFVWASDDRLLFFLDNEGNESRGIFAVDRDGKNPKMLIEPPESQIRAGRFEVLGADIVSLMENDPERVLISVSRVQDEGIVQDIETLNIYTGKRLRKIKNPGKITSWIADRNGEVIGAVRVDGVETSFLFRDGESKEFEEWSRSRTGQPSWSPAYISQSREKWYVSSRLDAAGNARDKAAIFRFDPKTRKIGELVYEHPDVDVGGVLGSRVADDMIGVSYSADKPQQVIFDPKLKALQATLKARFPDQQVFLSSASRDEQKMIFAVTASTNPGRFFLFDRGKNAFEELASVLPWLKESQLSPMKPLKIAARDGLMLPSYLTIPRQSSGKNLPLVLMPHGGPRARDSYGFDPMVQIMANRGYAVLQVNFRGSVGYGLAFDKAGWREWGGAMQQDLIDALKWTIAEGIADPQRICIFGASYGGYATMMGLVQNPELFKCGINYVGVTDLPLLLRTIPRAWEPLREDIKLQIGEGKSDLAELEARSPTRFADRIKAPVLMAYGARDPRVVLEHARMMERELKKNSVPYELIVKKDEGHGYAKFDNQVEFGEKVVAFLDKHIGAGAAGSAPAAATTASTLDTP
jgi:dipeptidyl aminopeptidase/acylaminoacyl peptidase